MLTDEEQIRALVETWHAATKSGDVDAVLSLMTDDVVFLAPGREPMGKTEFATMSKGPTGGARPNFEIHAVILEIHVTGDFAFMRTHLDVKVLPSGAHEPIHRAGHTLSVLRKNGGQWQIARDASLLTMVQKTSQ